MAKELNFFDLYGDDITQFKKEDKQEIVNVEGKKEIVNVEEKKESVNINETEIIKTEPVSNVQILLENDKTNKTGSDLNSLLLHDALNAADTEFGEVDEINNDIFTNNSESEEMILNTENNDDVNIEDSDLTDENVSSDDSDENNDEPMTNLLGEVITSKDKTKNSPKSNDNNKTPNTNSSTSKKKTKNNKELTEEECKKYKKIIVKYSGIEIMVLDENQIKDINLKNIKESLITTYNFGELNDDLIWRVIPSREEGSAYLQPSNKMMPKG